MIVTQSSQMVNSGNLGVIEKDSQPNLQSDKSDTEMMKQFGGHSTDTEAIWIESKKQDPVNLTRITMEYAVSGVSSDKNILSNSQHDKWKKADSSSMEFDKVEIPRTVSQ